MLGIAYIEKLNASNMKGCGVANALTRKESLSNCLSELIIVAIAASINQNTIRKSIIRPPRNREVMARRRYGRKTGGSRRKKMINVPLLSTASGLAIFTALNGAQAVNSALEGKVGTAVNTVASAMQGDGKAKLAAAVGSALIAKMLVSKLPRNVGKLGPVQFTTG